MAELLYRIGGFASRRSGIVIVAWVAILALAGVAFAIGGGQLANGLSIPGTPTAEVTERLATEFPAAAGGNGTIVFRTEDGKPFTDAQKAAITARIGAASDIDGVTQVVDPFATQAARDAQEQQTAAGQAQLDQASAQLDQGQAQLDAARAQAKASGTLEGAAAGLAAKQTELDQGKAQLDAQRGKLEAGAALLEMSSGIRLVSEDGSAAVAPVMFTATQFDVSRTKSAVQDAFSQRADPGRRGRLLDGDRLRHPVHPRRRRVGRPRHRGDRPDRHARHPRRRRAPDPERARRRRASASSARCRCRASSRWCRSRRCSASCSASRSASTTRCSSSTGTAGS